MMLYRAEAVLNGNERLKKPYFKGIQKATGLYREKYGYNTFIFTYEMLSHDDNEAMYLGIISDTDCNTEGTINAFADEIGIGRYVGWTAKIVRSKFKMAAGSVLFIDEAYSLVDGSNSFGDEAINTIVQEMENNRDDLIVIFAGYPKEMERFLNKNPGLRSRISQHIHFENYSAEELYSITEYMAAKDGMVLDSSVREKLVPIFDIARSSEDFGNGRYVRKVYEKAFMSQRCRLADMDIEAISKNDAELMLAKDFDIDIPKRKEVKIGFC